MKKPIFLSKLTVPLLLKKADFDLIKRPMSRHELYKISNDFKFECGVKFGITGSFALELHASKLNTPIHRLVHDVDFMVTNMDFLAMKMKNSTKFDFLKSSLGAGEDNAWIVHIETGFVVDIIKAGDRFGPLEIETINGFPVVSLQALKYSLENRGNAEQDLLFIQGLCTALS
jgi:hypothetical protein